MSTLFGLIVTETWKQKSQKLKTFHCPENTKVHQEISNENEFDHKIVWSASPVSTEAEKTEVEGFGSKSDTDRVGPERVARGCFSQV